MRGGGEGGDQAVKVLEARCGEGEGAARGRRDSDQAVKVLEEAWCGLEV